MKDAVALANAAAAPPLDAAAEAAALKVRRFDRMRKQRRDAKLDDAATRALSASRDGIVDGKLVPKGDDTSPTPVLALDCEMVGVGVDGKRSALARVCVVRPHFYESCLKPTASID